MERLYGESNGVGGVADNVDGLIVGGLAQVDAVHLHMERIDECSGRRREIGTLR